MQLERAVGKNEKLESFKLESLKLERTDRSWKVSFEVGKFGCTFNFPTSKVTLQLQLYFSTSARTFQLQSGSFQLQTFQRKIFQLLVLSNCPFQLHVSQKILTFSYKKI